jgi:hypothetical protein
MKCASCIGAESCSVIVVGNVYWVVCDTCALMLVQHIEEVKSED